MCLDSDKIELSLLNNRAKPVIRANLGLKLLGRQSRAVIFNPSDSCLQPCERSVNLLL